MRSTRTLAAAFVAALVLPAAAQAHVTLQPATAPADGYVVQAVRVPNERDDAATTKVVVQMPPGIDYAAYQPVAGWKAKVDSTGDAVSKVTFTATGKGIAPGSFQDFPLQVHVPDKAGTTLTFKALQTYAGGEVVRWIGAPDSDNPAPQVEVTEAAEEGHGASAGHDDEAKAEPTVDATPVAATTAAEGDGDGTGLAIAALAVGLIGLGVGGAGLAAARRAR